MRNSARIFKELRENWDELCSKYKPTDKVRVGLRYKDGNFKQAEATFAQLLELIFMCIDGKHPETEDMDTADLSSLFVVDGTGTQFYDSNTYKPSKNKYDLRNDKDTKVAKFNGLDDPSKEQVIELTHEQIQTHIEGVTPDTDLSVEDKKGDIWGDMPW